MIDNNLKNLNKYAKFIRKKRPKWHLKTIKEYLFSFYLNSKYFKLNPHLKIKDNCLFE